MEQDNFKEQELNVEISEEVAEGVYSNLVMIAHSNSEFVLDFTRIMPGLPKAKVKARIIITPEHAKRLLAALQDNIEKYEAAFGNIVSPTPEESFKLPMTFGGKMGEA